MSQYCATDASHCFAVENTTALANAFETIGDNAANQLTILTNWEGLDRRGRPEAGKPIEKRPVGF